MPGLVGDPAMHLTHQHLSFLVQLSFYLCSADGSSHPFNINYKECPSHTILWLVCSATFRQFHFCHVDTPPSCRTDVSWFAYFVTESFVDRTEELSPNCRFRQPRSIDNRIVFLLWKEKERTCLMNQVPASPLRCLDTSFSADVLQNVPL